MENKISEAGFYSVFFNEEIYINSVIPEEIKINTIVKESERPEYKHPPQPINFAGEYKKKILIIIENESNKDIDEQDNDFLKNVLKAVKLEFKDIALINIANNKSLNLSSIFSELRPEKIFGFGLNVRFTDNIRTNIKTFVNKSPALFMTYSLKEISRNTEFKKILWTNLKKIFL